MNSFVNIRAEYDPKLNFWELNPHMIYVSPFNHLYDRDTTKDKSDSSKEMWCIVWMSDPDDETNKYFRLPTAQLLETCKNYYPAFDVDDDLIQTCIAAYPEVCLVAIEQALKGEKEFLLKRSIFLRNAEYNYDTMKDLDAAAKATPNILANFEKIEQQFLEYKRKGIQIKAGRQMTAREKKTIKPELADDDN